MSIPWDENGESELPNAHTTPTGADVFWHTPRSDVSTDGRYAVVTSKWEKTGGDITYAPAVRRDRSTDYLTIGFVLWLGILFWVMALTIPVPVVHAPTAPDAPLLHMAAVLPALPTNIDSTWRPARRRCGAFRGLTGEWTVCR